MRVGSHGGYWTEFPKETVLHAVERQVIDHAMRSLHRWYGVSTGDGNSGVSHMFPDYYVFTNDPWRLAERAAQSCLKPDVEFEVDGEADYCISAVVYDDPSFYDDYDPEEDYSDWEGGYAPFILEVFPVEKEEVENTTRMTYPSIADALGS